jgi:hypothetical protein
VHRMWRSRSLLLAFASLVIALPVAAAQAKHSTGARAITDVAYAPPQPSASQGHLLDLYLPAHARAARSRS